MKGGPSEARPAAQKPPLPGSVEKPSPQLYRGGPE